MLLENKSVVITGAGSGVGRAATLLFAQQGAQIICADIAADRLEEVVSEVRAAGGKAQLAVCDVRSENDLAAAIDLATSAHGRLDIMFNNAGVASTPDGSRRPLHECTLEDYERLSSVNFKGTFHGAKLAVRRFLDQDDHQGVIINTASIAGMVGMGGVLYGATKGAVIQMTRALAIEVASYGIRVNAVCPSAMLTNFFTFGEGKSKEELEATFGALHPLGRPIEAQDVANAALFLASDMAKNITGAILPVDGGYIAR